MTEKVKEQILAIRDTGLTNMFDIPMVQRLAYERGYYELVCYLFPSAALSVMTAWTAFHSARL